MTKACKSLSPREYDVAAALRHGHSNKQIAAHFGLSDRTVGGVVRSICTKWQCPNRTAVAALAVQNGVRPMAQTLTASTVARPRPNAAATIRALEQAIATPWRGSIFSAPEPRAQSPEFA